MVDTGHEGSLVASVPVQSVDLDWLVALAVQAAEGSQDRGSGGELLTGEPSWCWSLVQSEPLDLLLNILGLWCPVHPSLAVEAKRGSTWWRVVLPVELCCLFLDLLELLLVLGSLKVCAIRDKHLLDLACLLIYFLLELQLTLTVCLSLILEGDSLGLIDDSIVIFGDEDVSVLVALTSLNDSLPDDTLIAVTLD